MGVLSAPRPFLPVTRPSTCPHFCWPHRQQPQHPQTGPSLLGWEDARRKCLQSAELRPGTGRHSKSRTRMHYCPCQQIPALPACLHACRTIRMRFLPTELLGGVASLVRARACCPPHHTVAPGPGSGAISGAKVIVTVNGTPKSLPDAPCLLPARGPDKLTSLNRVRSSCPHQCQWPGPALAAPE